MFEHGRSFPLRIKKLPTIIENTLPEITLKGLKDAKVENFTVVSSAKSAQTASAHNQRLRSTNPQIPCKKEIDNNPFSESLLVQKIFFSVCCLLMMSLMLVNHYET